MLWYNGFEKLSGSGDDGNHLLWLDFGGDSGRQVRKGNGGPLGGICLYLAFSKGNSFSKVAQVCCIHSAYVSLCQNGSLGSFYLIICSYKTVFLFNTLFNPTL